MTIPKSLTTYWWYPYAIEVLRTGSKVICNPPPKDTDTDYLLLVDPGKLRELEKKLAEEGWEVGGSLQDPGDLVSLQEYPDFSKIETKEGVFRSWKKVEPEGLINLILTCSSEYYTNFFKATLLSKRLNLLRKEDRIVLFEAVCFDVWP